MLDADGKVCPAPGLPYPPFLHFRMQDRTEIIHRNDAVVRAGRCPHCLIDFLHAAGLFHGVLDAVHICDFDLDGPSNNVRRNGQDLLAVLWSLGLPHMDALHPFHEGAQA